MNSLDLKQIAYGMAKWMKFLLQRSSEVKESSEVERQRTWPVNKNQIWDKPYTKGEREERGRQGGNQGGM